jgi:hypothetical protein
MINPQPAQQPMPKPEILALKHMFEKNHWLIRIRWIYPVFIMFFSCLTIFWPGAP